MNDLLTAQAEKSDDPATDFFFARLTKDLSDLRQRAEDAVGGGRLSLREGHSQSHLVLERAFHGQRDAIFRGVHFATDSRFMGSVVVDTWNDRMRDLLAQGRLIEVRRLVVYSSIEQLAGKATASFLDGERAQIGHSYRLIAEQDFRALMRRSTLDVPHDFGVYADSYVFLSASRDPSDLSGIWLADREHVTEFASVFDEGWSIGREKVRDA